MFFCNKWQFVDKSYFRIILTNFSGSKISKSLYVWPTPMNRIGFCVTYVTLNDEPPLTSASTFVNIVASMPIALLNSSACITASFPIRESTVKITRSGFTTRLTLTSSFMRFWFVCILPAVSIKTTFIPWALAWLMVSNATAAGSAPYVCLITRKLNRRACSSSCSIEPAR